MKLLALDTSTESCSVALRCGDALQVLRHDGAREQTAHVLPMVQSLLAEAGVSLRELDAIACACGPGAFTGVRVAVSVVQGLAYGAQVPAIGISTLAALAQQVVRVQTAGGLSADGTPQPLFILPALDARMGELYAGAYGVDGAGSDACVKALLPDRLVKPEQLAEGLPSLPAGAQWTVIGSGWQAYPALAATLPSAHAEAMIAGPDARDVLALAEHAFARGEAVPADQLLPVYLRDTVAWKKLSAQGKP